MSATLRDLQAAVRRLAQTPGFAAMAILMVALGTGATIALFTLFNALVLRPLPVPWADRLAVISVTDSSGERASLSTTTFAALRRFSDTV